jgi:acetoin utilization deacetylase AcuC-like enzyme
MTVAFISHPDCQKHEMGAHHPEQPARLGAITDRLIASRLDLLLRHYDAPPATRAQLLRVHDVAYVEWILAHAPSEGLLWLDGDTAMNPYSLRAALAAGGAAVLGVDLVMSGESGAAFCNVRPPGHHAERARAMGFCIFNNVAIGAAHALAEHGLERVAIVDFDVHHGNGTEDIFRDDPRVLFCSSFQHPFYPGSGADTVSDHIVNIPLPAGTGGDTFRAAVEARWLPALDNFRPQIILVSAGFDAHAEDDMAMLNLVEADYVWITAHIKRLADAHAGGRIVSLLEGGYNLSALGRSVAVHIDALLGSG